MFGASGTWCEFERRLLHLREPDLLLDRELGDLLALDGGTQYPEDHMGVLPRCGRRLPGLPERDGEVADPRCGEGIEPHVPDEWEHRRQGVPAVPPRAFSKLRRFAGEHPARLHELAEGRDLRRLWCRAWSRCRECPSEVPVALGGVGDRPGRAVPGPRGFSAFTWDVDLEAEPLRYLVPTTAFTNRDPRVRSARNRSTSALR